MPIRLNLLAEAQALEEERRRDPVKRAIWVGVALVLVMLAWCSSLQLKAMIAKGELNSVEAQLASNTNGYRQVLDSQNTAADLKRRFNSLNQLANNRLLYGTLLNALQKSTVDNVQLVRLKMDQSYAITEAVKPKTNDTRVIPGRPASATERITLTLDATDASPNPGDQVNRFKEALATNSYFASALAKTNAVSLKSLSAPQVAPANGKVCVLFSLEAHYPEKTR